MTVIVVDPPATANPAAALAGDLHARHQHHDDGSITYRRRT